jgi:hypothetical protein
MCTSIFAVCFALALSQGGAPHDPPEPDPYTGAEPARMAAAGVLRYAPLQLSRYFDTDDVDSQLPAGTFRWLETEHFRIGSSLAAYGRPVDREQAAKLRTELGQLRRGIPGIDPDELHLDRWLRVHLFAQRCEAAYASFLQLLDVCEDDFPPDRAEARRRDPFMGVGPYLGKPDKFVVVLAAGSNHYKAATARLFRAQWNWPMRRDLGTRNGMFFGTAVDLGPELGDDTALHAHVVYNLIHNFVDSYRHYFHDTPVWFKTGLAQHFLRQIDPRYPNYDRPPKGPPDARSEWQWERTIPRILATGRDTPLATMATWRDYAQFRFEDYVTAWSRVEFLLSRDREAFATFLFEVKDPITLGRQQPSWEQVLECQRAGLRAAWGYESYDLLDVDWRDWVERSVADDHDRRSRGRRRRRG